jgi:mannose-6-phosphate isomerase-like protein (cupin superfamily)
VRSVAGSLLFFFAPLALALSFAQTSALKHEATTVSLECATGDCPLLKGMPQTAGLRSGYVRLKPGESVGWHTTGQNEEALVILHGKGVAKIEGTTGMPVAEHILAYIPPATRHNVANTGTELLEYVYIVAPAAEK